MPGVDCPFPECTYNTGDVDAQLALELLKIHGLAHANTGAQTPHITAKVEKVHRPTLVADGTSEDWNYFLTRWAA